MPAAALTAHLRDRLADLRGRGLYKAERPIQTPQAAVVRVAGRELVNFCANNYLGLADHPDVVAAARRGLDRWAYGTASVRFICGTQDAHAELERRLAGFFGQPAGILYVSCFDANGGLFEPLLTDQDAVLSDELNHASIIDGVRLCKARRFRYKHADVGDLRQKLEEAKGCRFKLIFTDSVFSMDGDLAPLPAICDLADEYDALVGVDDCHGTGHLGATGRGAAEELGVLDRVDLITGTLGKALGGGVGGFTVGPAEVVDWLRNTSRPYLFSNAVPPAVCAAGLAALDLVASAGHLREALRANTRRLRAGLEDAGFAVKPGPTPILPVMVGDAAAAGRLAAALQDRGIYVTAFSYPVVPHGQARIRVQVSAAHTADHIDRAIAAFTAAGRELGVVGESRG